MAIRKEDVKTEYRRRGNGNNPAPRETTFPGEAETVATRRAQAVAMRVKGMPIAEIAEKLGVHRVTISLDLKECLNELHREQVALASVWQELELQRIDLILRSMAPLMDAGNTKAAAVYLKAAESRRKLLGIDEDKGSESKVTIEIKEVDNWGGDNAA
jgi:hypothetical protein